MAVSVSRLVSFFSLIISLPLSFLSLLLSLFSSARTYASQDKSNAHYSNSLHSIHFQQTNKHILRMLETVKYLLGSAGPSGFGSKTTAEQVTENHADLRSITAIITGATSGIGTETARVLAKRGARLVLPARSMKAAEDAKARIVSECPDSEIIVMALDLSSLNSVTNFVAHFHSLGLPLHLLINNAGKFAHEHAISEDGVEMTFATNYLGHFVMTNLLVKKMVETAKETGVQGRIVNVSSSIHGWFSGDAISYLALMSRNKR
ncbi:Short-chain dehydrogenase TIC 32, chloroplastic [Glycine soja]